MRNFRQGLRFSRQMTELGTSLRFVELSAVAELLASLASTGRLRLVSGEWRGEIVLRRGQIVAASLGDERGQAALESMAIGFVDGELNFRDGPVAEDGEALVSVEGQSRYLKRLDAVRQYVHEAIGSLQLVPGLVEAPEGGRLNGSETVGTAALDIVPQLVLGHSVEEIARRRGLGRTLREIAVLVKAGVVRLEAPVRRSKAQQSPKAVGATLPKADMPASMSAEAPLTPKSDAPTRPFAARMLAARTARLQPLPLRSASPRPASTPPPSPRRLPARMMPTRVVPGAVVKPPVRIAPPEPRRVNAASGLSQPVLGAPEPGREAASGWRAALVRLVRGNEPTPGRAALFEPTIRANRARYSDDPDWRLPR